MRKVNAYVKFVFFVMKMYLNGQSDQAVFCSFTLKRLNRITKCRGAFKLKKIKNSPLVWVWDDLGNGGVQQSRSSLQ